MMYVMYINHNYNTFYSGNKMLAAKLLCVKFGRKPSTMDSDSDIGAKSKKKKKKKKR